MSFSHHAPQHAVMLLLFWLVNFSELPNWMFNWNLHLNDRPIALLGFSKLCLNKFT